MRSGPFRMMSIALIMFGLTAAVGLALQAAPRSQATQTSAKSPPSVQDPGERAFQKNCSRCHLPPMTLSPRITGTVIMHMRTRARLSKQDEQLLLKYLAP
jgi:cytochrome c5